MPRTTLVLAALGCAALLLASPVVAKPTPDHADDRGPPDHANAPDDTGPLGSAGQAADEAAGSSSGTDEDPASSEASPGNEDPSTRDPGEVATTEEDVQPASVGPTEPATSTASPPTAGFGSASAGPSTQQAGSTPAPEQADLFLLGPTLAVGLLALGMVARVRWPDDPEPKTDTEVAETDASDAEEAADEDEMPEDPVTFEPPEPGPIGLLTLGRQALDRGNVEEAAGWFRTATMADPDRATAHFCLGLCLAELDRLDEAEAALAEARRQNPGDVEAAYAHAQVMARRGRNEPALRLLERLADDVPGLAERLREDEDWASLHDHPRWLALAGQLPDLGRAGPA